MCFFDESWPVRDAACVASGRFAGAYPEECRPSLDKLYERCVRSSVHWWAARTRTCRRRVGQFWSVGSRFKIVILIVIIVKLEQGWQIFFFFFLHVLSRTRVPYVPFIFFAALVVTVRRRGYSPHSVRCLVPGSVVWCGYTGCAVHFWSPYVRRRRSFDCSLAA